MGKKRLAKILADLDAVNSEWDALIARSREVTEELERLNREMNRFTRDE